MDYTPSKRTGLWGGRNGVHETQQRLADMTARDEPMIHVFDGLKQSDGRLRKGWATAGLKALGSAWLRGGRLGEAVSTILVVLSPKLI